MASAPVPHLLSLKVLRSSHPSLLGSQLQLQSAFGQIYLGETFSTIIAIENSSNQSVKNPTLSIYLQSTTTKRDLQSIEAEVIIPGKTLEGIVEAEIKELGLNSLVVSCTYGTEDGSSRSFRKVYKFTVSNPLSVRTKAHSPSPTTSSSFLVKVEREKVFLEVQIQNQMDVSILFERMRFEPLLGWTVEETFKHLHTELLAPGDVRQYIFILLANDQEVLGVGGESQALGKLDIVWLGESGALKTSLLGRRCPMFDPVSLGIVVEEKRRVNLEESKENRRDSIDSIRSEQTKVKSPYKPSNLSKSTSVPLESSPSLSSSIRSSHISPASSTESHLKLDFTVEKILSPIFRELPFQITINIKLISTLSTQLTRKVRLAVEIFDKETEILPILQVIPMSKSLSAISVGPASSSSSNPSNSIKRIGPSSIILDEFVFPGIEKDSPGMVDAGALVEKKVEPIRSNSIEKSIPLSFFAFNSGLFRVGGVRIRVLEDEVEGESRRDEGDRVLLELETFSEVWIER